MILQAVSNSFLEAVHNPGRQFKSKITVSQIGFKDVTYDDSTIVSITRKDGTIPDSGQDFEIGSVISTSLDVELKNLDGSLSNKKFQGAAITAFIGILLPDGVTYEYCALGEFFIDSIEKPDGAVILHCFDAMIKLEVLYASTLTYPATLLQIVKDIASKAGLLLANADFTNASLSVPTAPDFTGVTLRQALGRIAEAAGGFALISRSNQVQILWYGNVDESINSSNYYSLTVSDVPRTPVDGVIIKQSDDETDPISNGACSSPYTISGNPFLTENANDAVTALSDQLNGFSYMPYEVSWQGNPAIDAGDWIYVTDKSGNEWRTIVSNNEIYYDGGLKCDTKAVSQTETQQGFSASGTLSQAVSQAAQDSASYQNLTAQNFSAVNANIENLQANKASITDLEAINASITQLQVATANIATAQIQDAAITSAKIDVAAVGTENIQNAAITTALIDTGAVNTEQIADGSITDAKIVSLTANKLTAGTIDASKIDVTNLNCDNLTVGTINGEQIASGAIDLSKLTPDIPAIINNANSNASTALQSVNGKNSVFYGSAIPESPLLGDLWMKPAGDGVNPMQYVNGVWVSVTDEAIINKVTQPVTVKVNFQSFTAGASFNPPYSINCGNALTNGTYQINCGGVTVGNLTRTIHGGDAYGNRV